MGSSCWPRVAPTRMDGFCAHDPGPGARAPTTASARGRVPCSPMTDPDDPYRNADPAPPAAAEPPAPPAPLYSAPPASTPPTSAPPAPTPPAPTPTPPVSAPPAPPTSAPPAPAPPTSAPPAPAPPHRHRHTRRRPLFRLRRRTPLRPPWRTRRSPTHRCRPPRRPDCPCPTRRPPPATDSRPTVGNLMARRRRLPSALIRCPDDRCRTSRSWSPASCRSFSAGSRSVVSTPATSDWRWPSSAWSGE